MLKIGILNYRLNYYTYVRTIVNKVPGVEYVGVNDLYSRLNRMAKLANSFTHKQLIDNFDLNNQFNDLGLNKYDVLHLHNGVSYANKPWMTGLETIVPRFSSIVTRAHGDSISPIQYSGTTKRAFAALASNACKALLPWSGNCAEMQRDLNKFIPADLADHIEAKMIVNHPPQRPLLAEFEEKKFDLSGKIKFMLVGAGFFRKGGREVVDVFEDLIRHQGLPIELTIVSSLAKDNYAAHETDDDVKKAKAKIDLNRDWITYYPTLPNNEVIELMKGAHVGLLPTYADTYGFSALEFQAAGCPVITTNVRALPEINNNSVGWLIEVTKNPLGEAIYDTAESREILSQQIRTGLTAIVPQICRNPQSIIDKGRGAYAKILSEHDPVLYGNRLLELYHKALAR